MKGSLENVRSVLVFQKPKRIPIFDLIPNDDVLCYFNHGIPVEIADDRCGIEAIARATDATRTSYFSPMNERTEHLPDGRQIKYERWTQWTARRRFSSSQEYRTVKEKELAQAQALKTGVDPYYQNQRKFHAWFGEDYFYFLNGPSQKLMSIYGEVGLEDFSIYLYECEDIIIGQLELNTENACRWIAGLPDDDPFEAGFMGDDIAFKSGPLVNPRWLKQHYFPRLKRVVDAWHARGKKIMFHSDGNLNLVMDDLVAAGIDLLNPIEVAAGMDLRDLHRRYPELIFAGGIDVSHLLPFGRPEQIRDAVIKAIEHTEGQILVGSSTEVGNTVPLENFLAMRQAAMEYSLI